MTTRRLAAILAADVVGFSSMMEKDEEGTAALFEQCGGKSSSRNWPRHQGRLVKTTGDGFLAEFASPVEAVRCALSIQEPLLMASNGLRLRIGVNLGDIIIEDDGDVLGEGVNVAARLEQMADPGGLLVSGKIYEEVEGKIDRTFESRGEQQMKNLARPVRVYALAGATPSEREPDRLLLPGKPSIAVLPFTNMSGDPEQEYFADGISEDLLTVLSRFRWLYVIARNSAFVFKGRVVEMKEVGSRLGVRYILEGSTRKAGNRVRITAQLIETATGAHLWADRYDRDLSDIFTLQDEITRNVVSAIEPNIRAVEVARALAKRTEDLNAYDLFLRSLPEHHSATRDGFQRAEALLAQALEHDPTYAEAWAALSDCVARQVGLGLIKDWDRARARACDAAENAVRFDPENATVLAHAAYTVAMLSGHLERAVLLANRALQLNPNSASVLTDCGWVFVFDGNYNAALLHFSEAQKLSPIDSRAYLNSNGIAVALFHSKNYEEAARIAGQTLERWPHHMVALRYRAAALVRLGRLPEARAVVKRVLAVDPELAGERSKEISIPKRRS